MMIRGLLVDVAGVLYQGSRPVPGAAEALARLREAGVPVRLVTNSSRATRAVLGDRLRGMGFVLDDEEIYTAPLAAAAAASARELTPFLLIHPDLEPDLAGFGDSEPDAVLVGDAGPWFTYERLNAGFRLVMNGAPLLAIARNRYFREDEGLSLDMGPFVAALEYATGVEAELYGKPAPGFFREALQHLGCDAPDTLMVGDDVESDVQGALDAGLQAALVRTGKYRDGDEQHMDARGVLFDDFPALVDRLLQERSR